MRVSCSMGSAVPLLLLDLDNTVADRAAAFEHWTEQLLARCVPDLDGPARADARAFLAAEDRDGVRPRREFLAAVRERFELDAPIEALLADYRAATLAGFPPIRREAKAQLARLRVAGWKIALVTNGEAGVQEATVERVGVAPLLDGCVVSGAVGVRKPDPRIFELAAEHCGLPLDGAWVLGDGDADVLGAANAGLHCIWLARGRAWVREDCAPTRIATSLPAALAFLHDAS